MEPCAIIDCSFPYLYVYFLFKIRWKQGPEYVKIWSCKCVITWSFQWHRNILSKFKSRESGWTKEEFLVFDRQVRPTFNSGRQQAEIMMMVHIFPLQGRAFTTSKSSHAKQQHVKIRHLTHKAIEMTKIINCLLSTFNSTSFRVTKMRQ